MYIYIYIYIYNHHIYIYNCVFIYIYIISLYLLESHPIPSCDALETPRPCIAWIWFSSSPSTQASCDRFGSFGTKKTWGKNIGNWLVVYQYTIVYYSWCMIWLYNVVYRVLVGGFSPTPLKNHGLKVSWDDDIPFPIWKVIKIYKIPWFQSTKNIGKNVGPES